MERTLTSPPGDLGRLPLNRQPLGQTEPLQAKLPPTEAMRRPSTAFQGVILPVTEPSHAVFLSYASQDAEAAQKICEALRAAGIEVFLDQSELRGGDAWDQKIRHEIHDCALFIPMVSQHTQERLEGYFRLEWNLAIERTHHMARTEGLPGASRR